MIEQADSLQRKRIREFHWLLIEPKVSKLRKVTETKWPERSARIQGIESETIEATVYQLEVETKVAISAVAGAVGGAGAVSDVISSFDDDRDTDG